MAARYALVVAGSKDRTLEIVKPLAGQAMAAKRLRVVQGDLAHKDEFFPSKEARAWLRKAYNRGGSSPDPAARVRSVAIIFFQFYPTKITMPAVLEQARACASEAGFESGATEIHQIETADDLRTLLEKAEMVSAKASAANLSDLLTVLNAFEKEFPDDAVVSARAKNSATAWDIPDTARVLENLQAVHRVYGRWLDARGNPITARDRKRILSEETGLVLHDENANVTKKYRQSIFPEMDGRTLSYPLHIAYSYRSTRIHFWFPAPKERSSEPIRTLVAHAGRHLYNGERSQTDSG